jgi:gluconolactonase
LFFETEPGGGPCGLCQDKNGNFWVCLYSSRKLVLFSQAGQVLSIIDNFEGKTFNGPNDVAVASNGGIYFTDSGDFEEDWRSGRPIGSVYYLDPNGKLTKQDKDLCFSNGMALSPDEKNLFVNEHRKNRTLRYSLKPDGGLSDKEIFFKPDDDCLLDPEFAYELGPDGMGFDHTGCLWIAHYGGGKILQISPQGELMQKIYLPSGRKPTNVRYHPGMKALFVTEAELGLLYKIDY